MISIVTASIMFTGDHDFIDESNTNLKNYTFNELSFKYPESWVIGNKSSTNSGVDGSCIDKLINHEIGEIIINRQYIPSDYSIAEDFIPEELGESESKLKLTSKKKEKTDDMEVYENEYTLSNDSSKVVKELWINRNNAVYSIILYGNNSNVIDIIKSKIRISTKTLTKNPVFGTIEIPKLNYNWNIRSDTVNAYKSVYHYDNSYYPGEKGDIGLLGHHITYSAPFESLHKLVKGDKVYINDFLTQKKYTYEVTSNEDIRYDYETNPIQFKKGVKELIMGTCWPPGYTSAERYCYCKLVSIEPLR
jgi:sortase A